MSIQNEINRINANVAATYAAAEEMGADMPSEQNTANLPETVLTIKAVRYDEQTLSDEQKQQARENIGAASSEEIADLDAETLKEADRQSIVQDVIDSVIFVQGDVYAIYGEVDADKNIILHGELADDTYTVKYELEDGTKVDIGALTLGAKPLVPNFTNLADPTSADWLTDNRLNSSGGGTANPGTSVTNYIAVADGDVIRVKGLDMTNSTARIAGYNSNGTVLFSANLSSTAYATNKTVGADESVFTLSYSGIVKLRISGGLNGKAEDVIVTKNEEITYS